MGIFWQDGVAQSMFAYFINQGMIMRFLAVKSPAEGGEEVPVLRFSTSSHYGELEFIK